MMSIDHVSDEMQNQETAHPKESKSIEKPLPLSEAMRSFKEAFDSQENMEERLKMSIAFMRQSLSQDKTPRFKDFWETKKMCLALFKEKINPLVKAECWNEYTTLSEEAKRLKDLLEEESAFAIEQIELALKALETEVTQAEEHIQKQPSLEKMEETTFLSDKWSSYNTKQQMIQFYTAITGRMKALRKGVIDTEMRIRHKNRLLKQIAALGDQVIPKYKEDVKLITQEFLSDIQQFVDLYFDMPHKSLKESASSLHLLRESIKEFQMLAKKLSLNTRAFSETREKLSQCWEIVRDAEKERKKEYLERQEKRHADSEEAHELIQVFAKQLQEEPPTTKEMLYQKSKQVMQQIEGMSLSGGDFKALKTKLRELEHQALQPFLEQEKALELKKQKKVAEQETQVAAFKEEIMQTLAHLSTVTLKTLQELHAGFEKRLETLKPHLRDMQTLQELKKELYEALLLRKEAELTAEDQEALEELLGEWEAFREVTRRAVEQYRKEMGSSGFDFEKAMLFSKQMDLEKARLDRIIDKILDLEDKSS